jgi:hypothetical protein
MSRCTYCGQEIDLSVKVGRLDECPKCHRDLHACVQCRFYDRSAHNQCREPQAGWVADKERANFCGYFELGRDVTEEKKQQDDSKNKLEALFKK